MDGSRQKIVQLSLEVRLQKQDLQTVKNYVEEYKQVSWHLGYKLQSKVFFASSQ